MKKTLLILFMLVNASFTFAQTLEYNAIAYQVIPGTTNLEVLNFNCISGNVIIPPIINYGGTDYTVTKLTDYAFNYCSTITSITIPNTVTYIGLMAFGNCTSLTSVFIPSSVISIGSNTFQGCTNLATVICDIATPPVVSSTTFLFVNQSSCSLCVPAGSVSAYQSAPIWQNFNSINTCSALSSSNFNINNQIAIYPNPTKNKVFIDVKNLSNAKLDVVDITGKTLFSQLLNLNNTIDTSSLTNGIYLFKVTSNEGTAAAKVVKN
jgi:hypothetical protein